MLSKDHGSALIGESALGCKESNPGRWIVKQNAASKRGLLRRPVILVAIVIVATLSGVGLYLFQPWKVFTSSTVDEALPSVAAVTSAVPSSPPAPATSGPTGAPATSAPPAPPQPSTLASGDFVSQEHETRGKAAVLRLADGSRVLRLTGLASSDGPDLHIWLTDQSAGGEWGKYDDGRYLKLGKLKATHGNQNYAIPAEAKLDGLRSVVIWCDRFNVAFGSAPLTL